ncbi:MAG: RNA pseudouridine synthase [Hyphomonadaceae bacterium]|nr:RNA pseudouridine synthase [Hyphomonadaceae bacterium]
MASLVQSHPVLSGRDFIYDPPQQHVSVIYEDDSLILVDKPAGLLSVPGKAPEHQDCLEQRVKQKFDDALLVHRLDMATSGIMVFARNARAHRHLGLQFERRHVEKTYIAHIWGRLKSPKGQIDLPLICDWPNRPMQKVDFDAGKKAKTDWEVLKELNDCTIVRLTPLTGRSHQLRVHMNEQGCPILGDRLYAHEDAFKKTPRLMLHAESLSIFHPDGGQRHQFEAPVPF